MKRIITINRDVQVPHVPDYILADSGGSIPIQELNDDELKLIADIWCLNLIELAQIRRKAAQ